MKHITRIAALLCAVMIAGQLLAQPGEQQPGPGGMGRMHGGRMMGGMGPMMQHQGMGPMQFLNLTDEQKQKAQTLMLQHRKEILPLEAEIEKHKANLKLELTADKFDAAKTKSIQSELAKVMNEIGSKRIVHQRAIRDLLTPEQRVKFDQHILSGARGPGGPRGGMRGPMMGGPQMGRQMGRGQRF